MKMFRCQICGDTYLGEKKPSNCPFCGAHEKSLVPSHEWRRETVVLSELSRRNLEEALRIEVSNARFYKAAAAISQIEMVSGMFKALSKIEAEHASIHARLLQATGYEDLYVAETAGPDDATNIAEALRRERNAVARYGHFASEAVEPRVKQVFQALVEIESDHVRLDEQAAKTGTRA